MIKIKILNGGENTVKEMVSKKKNAIRTNNWNTGINMNKKKSRKCYLHGSGFNGLILSRIYPSLFEKTDDTAL